MKTKFFFLLMLLACSLQLMAQVRTANLTGNQIIGTWKMLAQTGIGEDGTAIKPDLTKVTQYKIITPTHWMFVAYNSDSLKGGGEGGTYLLQGNKYVETLDWAKTEYTVKVEGDKFYQDGFIFYPDGKKVELHEVYQRIEESANATTPDVGTWNMTSYEISRNGKKVQETGVTELEIVTPTHSMWVDKKDGKFWMAMISKYTKEGNKIMATPLIASFPVDAKDKTDITSITKGDQRTSNVKITHGDGTTEEWNMVHQRVGKPKIVKAVLSK